MTALRQITRTTSFSYTPVDFGGLPQAVVALLQILILGTLLTRTILPDSPNRLFLKVVSLGFGFTVTGLFVTILANTRTLYLWPMEALFLSQILLILAIQSLRSKESFVQWLKSLLAVWKIDFSALTRYERAVFAGLGVITLLAYFDAIMFPIAETDALIYHASAASIVYYNHGMPLIDGAGVGLGTSANYPLLFSYLGTYFYMFVGAVKDVYLRALTPTMWLLSILTTYLAGLKIGGRRIGLIAMFLVAMVPSYLSYAYQTTQETTETFFLALGFLLLIYAINEKSKAGYYQACGIFFGAACLVSYQALYYLVPLGLTLGIMYLQTNARGIVRKNLSWLIVSLAAVGSAPYIRNLILLHNPVYPFFSGIFQSRDFSPTLFNFTVDIWRYVAYTLVNPNNPTASGFFINLIAYRSLYPLNATLIIPSLLILAVLPLRQKWTIAFFIIIPSAFIITSPTPFVRYFWLGLPYAAIIVALVLTSGDEALRLRAPLRTTNKRITRLTHLATPLTLVSMIVFPAFVLVGVQNYTFIPFENPTATGNYLNYFTNPGMPASMLLPQIYGSDVSAWRWLDQNVVSGRVATFESRVYYMDFALQEPSAIFYLDSSYALPIYGLSDLQSSLNFLQSQNIRYIFIRSQDWDSSPFLSLPFTRFLTSPYFPQLFADGLSQVYGVGPKSDDIVKGSVLAYSYHFSNSYTVGGNFGNVAENVTQDDDSPRLYVETDNALTQVGIEYLDSGFGHLDVNAYNPALKSWIYGYAKIQKTNTNKWLNSIFLVPMNYVNSYTELGLHAGQDNFTIRRIIASHVTTLGRTSYRDVGLLPVSNQTNPRSIMIYLPIMTSGDTLSVATHTQAYNFSLDIFSGYIPLNQTSGWMMNHQEVMNFPLTGGAQSPSMQWSVANTGIYTLVITLTDNTPNNVTIDVAITLASTT